jgi:hypothetical protein
MNEKVKQLWVEALPKYTQTKGRLKSGNCFCVLGVLCDLYIEHHPDSHWAGENGDMFSNPSKNNFNTGTLPFCVMEWAGIEDWLGPILNISGNETRVSYHNDIFIVTFEELAKAIETQC